MAGQPPTPTESQRFGSLKRRLVIASLSLAFACGIAAFVKRAVHASNGFYLYVIPYAILVSVFAFRPAWLLYFNRKVEEQMANGWKTLDKKKWNWPGFP